MTASPPYGHAPVALCGVGLSLQTPGAPIGKSWHPSALAFMQSGTMATTSVSRPAHRSAPIASSAAYRNCCGSSLNIRASCRRAPPSGCWYAPLGCGDSLCDFGILATITDASTDGASAARSSPSPARRRHAVRNLTVGHPGQDATLLAVGFAFANPLDGERVLKTKVEGRTRLARGSRNDRGESRPPCRHLIRPAHSELDRRFASFETAAWRPPQDEVFH